PVSLPDLLNLPPWPAAPETARQGDAPVPSGPPVHQTALPPIAPSLSIPNTPDVRYSTHAGLRNDAARSAQDTPRLLKESRDTSNEPKAAGIERNGLDGRKRKNSCESAKQKATVYKSSALKQMPGLLANSFTVYLYSNQEHTYGKRTSFPFRPSSLPLDGQALCACRRRVPAQRV